MSIILGIKKEMTQLYSTDGSVVPVTIIDTAEVFYAGVRIEAKDGYNAIILAFGKKNKPNKPETNKYKELGFVPKYVQEFRVDKIDETIKTGQKIDLTGFALDQKVAVSGITKGKGFQGVVKRWGFHGGSRTHGQSDRMRAPGSIGSGTTPGRINKGKKMGGHMGNELKTVKNLKVALIDLENNYIALKGAVPGNKGSLVIIKN
ncbi:MAG: 50S ribosomal protein L3 [bacterium]